MRTRNMRQRSSFDKKGRRAVSILLTLAVILGVCFPYAAFGGTSTSDGVSSELIAASADTATPTDDTEVPSSTGIPTESIATPTSTAALADAAEAPDGASIPAGSVTTPSSTVSPADATEVPNDADIPVGVAPLTPQDSAPQLTIAAGTGNVTLDGTSHAFNFTAGTTSLGTMTVSDGQNAYAPTTNPFELTKGEHVQMTLTGIPDGYEPSLTVTGPDLGFTPVFNFDSATGTYGSFFDTTVDATVTISITEIPKLSVATDTANNTLSLSGGTFTFKSADGSTTLGTMTVSDGLNTYAPTTNPFELTHGHHVELAVTTANADYMPVLTGVAGTALQQDQVDKTKWSCVFDTSASVTVTMQIAQGYMLSLPAVYDAGYLSHYGTVQWATSPDATTWNPITTGTIASTSTMHDFVNNTDITLYNYTFTSSQSVYIKATWPAGNPGGFTAMEGAGAFEGGSIDNGVAKQLIGSGGLQYDDWYTINWAYDTAHSLGSDDQVYNGKIVITSVTGGVDPAKNQIGADGSGTEGLAFLSSGAQVTIKFVPDPGYQFTGVKANGQPIEDLTTAADDLYTYTFTAKGMIHFSSTFEKYDDIVTNKATGVESAAIANGAAAVGSGNAQLNVTNETVDNGIQVQLQAAAGDGATIQSILGLTLNQIITKGAALDAANITDENAWIMQKTELDQPVTVSVVLDEGVVPAGQTVTVVRRHLNADGTTSIVSIDCTYDAATRTLTFTSALFSDFAIATVPVTTDTATTDTATTASASTEKTVQTKTLASTGDGMAFGIVGFGFLLAAGAFLVLACRRRT